VRHVLSSLLLLALLAPRLFSQTVAVMRTGDVFDMRLSGVPSEFAQDFTLAFTVSQDGTVNVPLIGEVKAAGLTATQLERTMQDRFVAGKIFTQPTVIINPTHGLRTVSVSGGIRSPGRVQWTPDLTLRSAIGGSGGFSDFAQRKRIQIIRESKSFGIYNINDIEKDPGKDPKLLPGDQVWVPGD
jgi:polysaccharide export outer membrane protein